MTIHVHATYRAGLIHPDHPLNLPEGAELKLTVEADSSVERPVPVNSDSQPARILSPTLARPEHFVDFPMEVREITDAGV
jgi:hypothetical protein